MSSQAYSLVIAKVKEGTDADKLAKAMSENIDMRKWICVSAEVLYATSTEDLVFLVMSSEEMAKPVFDAFKNKVGNVGEEYKKEEFVLHVDKEIEEKVIFLTRGKQTLEECLQATGKYVPSYLVKLVLLKRGFDYE
jgi:hypothetical protein